MGQTSLIRMLATIGAALLVVAWLYYTQPSWFSNDSTLTMPAAGGTPTPVPDATKARPRPTSTPAIPRVGATQHLDDVWLTLRRVDHSQGAGGVVPNIGDEFLVAHLRIVNRSESNYRVSLGDFVVLDSNGQLDPPLQQDFTRRKLREVQLIPGGHTEGTLIFEAPKGDLGAELLYAPDILSPSKRKVWLLR
jgi:Domain of unknown function (DUF4352)